MQCMRSRSIFIDYLLPTRTYNYALSREGYFVLHLILGYIAKIKKSFFLNLNDIEWTDDINIAQSFHNFKEARNLARLWNGGKVESKPTPSPPLDNL